MKRSYSRWAVVLLGLTVLPGAVFAEKIIYQYTDSTGATAFTKDLSDVPVNQRPKAAKGAIDIDTLPPINVLTSPPDENPAAKPAKKGDVAAVNPSVKTQDYWQGRYDKALHDRDTARTQLQMVQYSIRDNNAYGGPGMQQRQADYAKKEADLKNTIAKLDVQVNGGIAEEARRAGAPESWFRNLNAGDAAH